MLKHKVKDNESVISLSHLYGIPVDKIWNHPDNQKLKDKNRTPGILCTGDELTIPDKEINEVEIQTGKLVKIKVKRISTTNLSIRFYLNGKSRANETYLLKIENNEFRGKLEDDGKLDIKVPVNAKEAVIFLGNRSSQQKYILKIGDLDPVSEVRGVKQRLMNLGFFWGELNSTMDAQIRSTIKYFQKKYKLNETGEIDSATQNKLREIYGS